MRKRRALVTGILLGALVLGACGDDDGEDAAPADTDVTEPTSDEADAPEEPTAADLAKASATGDWTITITITALEGAEPEGEVQIGASRTRTFTFSCADGSTGADCPVQVVRENAAGIQPPEPVDTSDGFVFTSSGGPEELCPGYTDPGVPGDIAVDHAFQVTDAEERDGVWVATALGGTIVERHVSSDPATCPGYTISSSVVGTPI